MKLFVTDFDRTLSIKREVSIENIEAIKKWQGEGNLFVIATGRDIRSLIERIEVYDMDPDYFICNNGAVVFDENLKEIYSRFIDKEDLLTVSDYILNNYEGAISLSEEMSKIGIRPIFGENNERDYKNLITLNEIQNVNRTYQIHKRFKDEKMTKVLEEDLNSRFNGQVVAYANSHNVDIVASGVNKSSAIKFLEERLRDVDKVITMGDSYNDLKMVVDYNGYMIASSKEEILKIAPKVIESVGLCLELVSRD